MMEILEMESTALLAPTNGTPYPDTALAVDAVKATAADGDDNSAEEEEEDTGAAEIEFVPPTRVKIQIDIDQLNWRDFLEFEKLSSDLESEGNVEKVLAMCRRCVVNHEDPMTLPMSTFQPVMKAITKGIQGRSNRKNSK